MKMGLSVRVVSSTDLVCNSNECARQLSVLEDFEILIHFCAAEPVDDIVV